MEGQSLSASLRATSEEVLLLLPLAFSSFMLSRYWASARCSAWWSTLQGLISIPTSSYPFQLPASANSGEQQQQQLRWLGSELQLRLIQVIAGIWGRETGGEVEISPLPSLSYTRTSTCKVNKQIYSAIPGSWCHLTSFRLQVDYQQAGKRKNKY